MLTPTGFWSYTTSDDTNSRGKLSQLRALLAAELQQQVGGTPKVNIFQDVAAIPPGAEWERQIRASISDASFLIPIVTPGFLQSEWCCREVTLFRKREEQVGVRNLVFPIHYVDSEHVDAADRQQCPEPEVLEFLRARQWTDFRHLRFRSQENEDVAIVLETLAKAILKTLRDVGLARQRAEEQKRQQEADARKAADARQREEAEREARLTEKKRVREEATLRAETERAAKAEQARLRAEAKASDKRRLEEAVKRTRIDGEKQEQGEGQLERSGPTLEAHGQERQSRSPAPAETHYALMVGLGCVPLLGLAILIGSLISSGWNQSPSTLSGVEASKIEAVDLKILDKEASEGKADAMYKLGEVYASGDGVARDLSKAREWFQKAAAVGETRAMYKLGLIYQYGDGVGQDESKAREWFAKAASVAHEQNSQKSPDEGPVVDRY